MNDHARLAIVDGAALTARARAKDWAGVEILAASVIASDHTREVLELLARLVAGCLSDLGAANDESEDDVFENWFEAATVAVGDLV